jgi:inositol-pentakisphosphate 2-kinase
MRRSKIIGSNFGLLYRDVAFLPKEIYMGKTINGEFKDSSTICIEIKAKQGYMLEDDDSLFVKKCRYCYFQVRKQMFSRNDSRSYFVQLLFSQYLKLENDRIDSVSNYCPIDLFSGNAERMNRAIKGLLDNPQNNLKMFHDGKMVYNEYSKDTNAMRRVLSSLFHGTMGAEK